LKKELIYFKKKSISGFLFCFENFEFKILNFEWTADSFKIQKSSFKIILKKNFPPSEYKTAHLVTYYQIATQTQKLILNFE